jgi:transposase-like protein
LHLRAMRIRNAQESPDLVTHCLQSAGSPTDVILVPHYHPLTVSATHSAQHRMGMHNEFNFRWENPVRIRCCQYLNNAVEQGHRRIKSRVQPTLGFKKFSNARRVLIGIEFRHMAAQEAVRRDAYMRFGARSQVQPSPGDLS